MAAVIPRTTCVYCGTRISGTLPAHRLCGSLAYRTALRRAANVACDRHLLTAVADALFHSGSVDTVDRPTDPRTDQAA
jgi:hypothetical protein